MWAGTISALVTITVAELLSSLSLVAVVTIPFSVTLTTAASWPSSTVLLDSVMIQEIKNLLILYKMKPYDRDIVLANKFGK